MTTKVVLLPLPLGEGRGEGWRSMHKVEGFRRPLALTPTLSQRDKEQEKAAAWDDLSSYNFQDKKARFRNRDGRIQLSN